MIERYRTTAVLLVNTFVTTVLFECSKSRLIQPAWNVQICYIISLEPINFTKSIMRLPRQGAKGILTEGEMLTLVQWGLHTVRQRVDGSLTEGEMLTLVQWGLHTVERESMPV